jgi:hypothetical protein
MFSQRVLKRRIMALSLVAACGSDPDDPTADSDGSTTAPDGPAPGAPDELCAMDPESVYAVVREGYNNFYSLVNLDDPSIKCTLNRSASRMLMHPANGALLTLRQDGPLLELIEVAPDWLEQNFYEEWVPSQDDNDIVIAEVPYYPNMRCPQVDGVVDGDVFTDFTQVYAHCGGEVLNAPDLGFDLPGGIIGRVNGVFIFGGLPVAEGYAAWTAGGQEPLPGPVGVDYYCGLASRPDGQGLLAVLDVDRDGAGLESSLERARIDDSGVSLTGEVYAYDLADAGYPWVGEHRIDARGNLFALAGPDDDGNGRRDVGAPLVVLRMTLEDPPEVVYESPSAEIGVASLLGVATTTQDPF